MVSNVGYSLLKTTMILVICFIGASRIFTKTLKTFPSSVISIVLDSTLFPPTCGSGATSTHSTRLGTFAFPFFFFGLCTMLQWFVQC